MQNSPYAAFDLVAVAASLGGVPALANILRRLPSDFPAALLVVQHGLPAGSGPPSLIQQTSSLTVRLARHGDAICPATVYLAPPDYHLLVDSERHLSLERGPRVKFCRPSAEPLFASVAAAYRSRALGVVLTGCNTDGAIGTQLIKWLGGRVLVQDPAGARASGMPRAAIATGCVDFVLPLERIADALIALVMAPGAAEFLRVPVTAA